MTIAVSPQDVWALVSDVIEIGSTLESFEAAWLDGATGLASPCGFRGHVKRREGADLLGAGVITECEPNRAFGFTVGSSVEKGLNSRAPRDRRTSRPPSQSGSGGGGE